MTIKTRASAVGLRVTVNTIIHFHSLGESIPHPALNVPTVAGKSVQFYRPELPGPAVVTMARLAGERSSLKMNGMRKTGVVRLPGIRPPGYFPVHTHIVFHEQALCLRASQNVAVTRCALTERGNAGKRAFGINGVTRIARQADGFAGMDGMTELQGLIVR